MTKHLNTHCKRHSIVIRTAVLATLLLCMLGCDAVKLGDPDVEYARIEHDRAGEPVFVEGHYKGNSIRKRQRYEEHRQATRHRYWDEVLDVPSDTR